MNVFKLNPWPLKAEQNKTEAAVAEVWLKHGGPHPLCPSQPTALTPREASSKNPQDPKAQLPEEGYLEGKTMLAFGGFLCIC